MWLPEALSIGVDYSTFWTLNPKKLESFITAFKQKTEFEFKKKKEEINFSAWLSGVYFGEAVSALLSKKSKYPKEPFPLEPKTEEGRFIEMKSAMMVWANKVNDVIANRPLSDGGEE